MTEDTRKSGRKRKRNTKYDSETWENLLEAVGAPSDDETNRQGEAEDSAEEFVAIEEEAELYSEPDEEVGEGEEVSDPDDASADEQEEDVEASDEDDDVPATPDDQPAQSSSYHRMHGLDVAKLKGVGTTVKPATTTTTEFHSRGIRYNLKTSSRDKMLYKAFGEHEEDLIPLLKVRAKWFDEITIPSRKPDQHGIGGMDHSFWVPEAVREYGATKGWDWYYDGGGQSAFKRLQTSTRLSHDEAQKYTSRSSKTQDFVMGPASQQKLFKLHARESLNINDAFNRAADPSRSRRKGWILNAGGPAHCLGWVPNQVGLRQYLAISTFTKPPPLSMTKEAFRTSASPTAPAFAPSDPAPSTIQIWAFTAVKVGTATAATIDMRMAPCLGLVLCLDWGHVKEFKWCPSLRNKRSSDEENYLGLLGLITSDGKLRVLDITYPQENVDAAATTTQYLHIQTAAFESRPPNTIYTSLTWISSTHLAAGCANGYVTIWDLSSARTLPPTTNNHQNHNQPEPQPHTHHPLPTFHHPIDLTYITTLTSLSPSRPHLLVTGSPTGHHRLTDLRAPTTGTVLSQRSRVISANAIWHDQSQHVFSADDSYTIRGFCARNFFQSVLVGHEEAPVSCLAKSDVQPALLVGFADGNVGVLNPLRRLMHRRKHEHYKHIWWRAEWRRGIPKPNHTPASTTEESTTTTEPAESNLDFPSGLTRLTTSYAIQPLYTPKQKKKPLGRRKKKPTSPSPSPSPSPPPSPPTNTTTTNTTTTTNPPKPAPKNTNHPRPPRHRARGSATAVAARTASSGTIYSTIYEEESGVTCVAWNGNLEAAGWAAVGWGVGLVAVEDLCWD